MSTRVLSNSINHAPSMTPLEHVTLWALLDWWDEGICELPECGTMSWFLWNDYGDYVIRH